MALFYSAGANAFFDDEVHQSIPEDAQAITREQHVALLTAQARGAEIRPGRGGAPKACHIRPTAAQARDAAIRRVKREAARRIEAIAPLWRQLNDQRDPSPMAEERFAAIDAIRTASNAIEAEITPLSAAAAASFDVANHPLWPAE
ncbi:hypothetical protein P7B04_10920 [Sphingobium yanoikuyae]|uniref:hypothetical protein n=1 Tax=Sphingobium yanoikuyae TaxID=13690 RepID=UPI00240FE15A|nr:hypothetical protein [Sphingobium yanoikuyae]MDG2513205.1 hypothetical protein [Sphingobium yanoikuyae]